MTESQFFPYTMVWGALLLVVLILAIVRGKIAAQEDDALKLGDGEVAAISRQESMAKKLGNIEAIGKWLTVALGVSGLIFAALYGWGLFNNNDMFAK